MTKTDLRSYFTEKLETMLTLTEELCAIESPTSDKAAVDKMGERITAELRDLGAEIVVHPRSEVGDILEGHWNLDKPGRPLLFISHMDTVHPVGELERNPIRREEGKLYGPGSYDMRGSIAAVFTAIRGLQDLGIFPDRPIIALMTSDEETGSPHSRDLIKEMAANAALCLIMESAMKDGSVKTWRKSVGHFTVRAYGDASHAGVAHEQGLNAIEEMANQVLKLQRMTRYKVGTTVNTGVITGGTVSNVVPDFCELKVDARAMTLDEMERVTAEILSLEAMMPGARLEVEGEFDRPPMERNDLMQATFGQAERIAGDYGLTIRENGTGGASDGNHTAGIGTATLDGLGPVGDGAHTGWEHIIIETMVQSATLLGSLILEWEDAE